jgi:hypothetical protein
MADLVALLSPRELEAPGTAGQFAMKNQVPTKE